MPTMKSRRKKQPSPVTYTVYVYRVHHSGIGYEFVKEEQVTEKPSYDTHWRDETNKVWARTVK